MMVPLSQAAPGGGGNRNQNGFAPPLSQAFPPTAPSRSSAPPPPFVQQSPAEPAAPLRLSFPRPGASRMDDSSVAAEPVRAPPSNPTSSPPAPSQLLRYSYPSNQQPHTPERQPQGAVPPSKNDPSLWQTAWAPSQVVPRSPGLVEHPVTTTANGVSVSAEAYRERRSEEGLAGEREDSEALLSDSFREVDDLPDVLTTRPTCCRCQEPFTTADPEKDDDSTRLLCGHRVHFACLDEMHWGTGKYACLKCFEIDNRTCGAAPKGRYMNEATHMNFPRALLEPGFRALPRKNPASFALGRNPDWRVAGFDDFGFPIFELEEIPGGSRDDEASCSRTWRNLWDLMKTNVEIYRGRSEEISKHRREEKVCCWFGARQAWKGMTW
uniref:RING-type domain-containing protein n=1 Tax=Chromera velia CCMP2878 TaxID=1169474 RepID=A0A0G4HQA7_9ALVE|eukprot:Cvel_30084.t1-p1 / transcript=Cvel_30084.t1 / gene=Cvel_30084 / organism=Chromera_velia_CCMP2878 / gene_product=hypothetical protein / transcript_product=hypothetical protein / location=Cvel_scaffold4235:4892-7036(-) / protein_length=380 / sequence_SO=supercontig / SO=protein_coding / is_pseudo=false